MKKFTFPIIIAAALIVGAIVAVVLINKNRSENTEVFENNYRPLTEEEIYPSDVEVKSGTYYRNGDKSSDLWLEVNSDFFRLKGNNIDEAMRNAVIEDGFRDERSMKSFIESIKTMYSTEKYYIIENDTQQFIYRLRISREGNGVNHENLKTAKNTTALRFNSIENSIRLGSLGYFILVE